MWHLTPDTTYIFAVSLERPGIGGRGTMGPELELKTKCMSPSRPVSHVTTSSPTYDSVQVKWQVSLLKSCFNIFVIFSIF